MTVLACAGELCNVQPDTFLIDSPWLSEAKIANVCICNMHKAATLDIGACEADSVQFELMQIFSNHGHLSRSLCKGQRRWLSLQRQGSFPKVWVKSAQVCECNKYSTMRNILLLCRGRRRV